MTKEREGYRYYASEIKAGRVPVRRSPYEKESAWDEEWEDGFDLADYDYLIGDLEDEL